MKLQKAYPEPYRLSFHKRVPLSCGLFTLGNLAASAISSPRELCDSCHQWSVIAKCPFLTSSLHLASPLLMPSTLSLSPLSPSDITAFFSVLLPTSMPRHPPHPITSFSAWPRGPHPTPQPAAPLLMKVKFASSTQIPLLSLRASPDDRGHPLHSHCLGQTGSLENLNSGIQIPYLSDQESL